jgi:hypothetical protein
MKSSSWFAVEVTEGVWHSKYLNERELDERNPSCQILGPFATIKDSLTAIEAESISQQYETFTLLLSDDFVLEYHQSLIDKAK